MTAALIVSAAAIGLVAGAVVNRAAGAFPWSSRPGAAPAVTGEAQAGSPVVGTRRAEGRPDGSLAVRVAARRGAGRLAVRPPVLEVATATLFVLIALRFGAAWDLPAFLYLGGVGVLLTLIDLRHHLLPNRVVVPSYAVGAALLLLPAAAWGEWSALLRAGSAAVVLFVCFLALALISPSSLGMGDVKLAGVLGLHLGWFGWETVVLGAAAGFVVQALLALVLLVSRRIGLRGELPFGPAMLLGAALVIAVTGQHPLV